jgi:2-C-methyl-D-erythritol 4-phosphate cytidylyltransferase
MHSKEVAVIVAGGKGLRLPGDTPKQFIEIAGLPVLMHSLNAFLAYDHTIEIIVVLPASDMERWPSLCARYGFTSSVRLVSGGETRFQSVRNGLDYVSGRGLAAIHDGVRPLVTPEIIATSFDVARKYRSAVASVPLKESIREMQGQVSIAADRSRFRIMQTPQTFEIDLLKHAYAFPEDSALTDDASVAERAGHPITLFEGNYDNLKITTPVDLAIAEAILNVRMSRRKI